jgi:hypothetical protein
MTFILFYGGIFGFPLLYDASCKDILGDVGSPLFHPFKSQHYQEKYTFKHLITISDTYNVKCNLHSAQLAPIGLFNRCCFVLGQC